MLVRVVGWLQGGVGWGLWEATMPVGVGWALGLKRGVLRVCPEKGTV